MKTQRLHFLPQTIVILILSCSFSSCLKDNCEQTYSTTIYTPVYMSEEEIRAAISIMPASELKNLGKIYYRPPYLFINEIDKGIHIINNADPSNPENISFLNIPGNLDIAVTGNILYADSYIDLVVLDISDPLNIIEVDRKLNVFPNREYEGFTGNPDLGVVVDWIATDTIITETCEQNQEFFMFGGSASSDLQSNVFNASGISGSTARFALVNDYLYCVTPETMELFDISNPSSPQQGATLDLWTGVETIFPYNNYLFIGTNNGVLIYENSVPEMPTYVSGFAHITSCDPVVVSGNYAYSTLRGGNICGSFVNQLDILDITNINSPFLIQSYPMTSPWGLGIDNENLFICDGASGLKMYDVSNPLNIQLLQIVDILNPYDVIPVENLLIVTSEDGLYQFDYSTGTLIELSKMTIVADI